MVDVRLFLCGGGGGLLALTNGSLGLGLVNLVRNPSRSYLHIMYEILFVFGLRKIVYPQKNSYIYIILFVSHT
jgi:hypothetical protein